MNKTLNERARSMRILVGLPKMFWAEAVNIATYLINCGPSFPLDSRIVKEVWSGKEVNLSHLRVFGCISYVHIDAERSKLDVKSKKMLVIMGMSLVTGFGVMKIGKSSQAEMSYCRPQKVAFYLFIYLFIYFYIIKNKNKK